jgi:hypothetical protein
MNTNPKGILEQQASKKDISKHKNSRFQCYSF